jgi:hypothetical protein
MKKLLLNLLEIFAEELVQKTGEKCIQSGIWRSGNQYIPLSYGERFPPCKTDYWYLVVAV